VHRALGRLIREGYTLLPRSPFSRAEREAARRDAPSLEEIVLVRITNLATGHVFYCRTFNPDSITPTNNGRVHTNFTVPSDIELGDSQLEVVTNGIPSKAKAALVK